MIHPKYPELPAVSFICAIIVLLPATAHWKARNVATLSIIAWLFVINMIRFINTLVWANNVIVKYRAWCDLTTKLTVGVTIALPAAALCICRYLEAVASVRWARQTEQQKRNRMWFELFMCYGLPIIVMALHYITQGHRYDLYEHFGCQPNAVLTWLAIVILYVTPLVLSLIAFVYAGLAVRHFYRRRLDFKKHLSSTNAGITPNRYARLMALALTEMCFDMSINIWILWLNVSNAGLLPFISWWNIHQDFSRVQPYPQFVFPVEFWRQTMFAWYVIPIATFLFWIFFAFGQESMAEYRSWGRWFRRVILRREVEDETTLSGMERQMRMAQEQRRKMREANRMMGDSSGTDVTEDSIGKKGGYAFGFGGGKGDTLTLSALDRIHIPGLPMNSSGGTDDTLTTPRTPKKGMGDDESFTSEYKYKQPLSPISPPPLPTTQHHDIETQTEEPGSHLFDTISHISISLPPSSYYPRAPTPPQQPIQERRVSIPDTFRSISSGEYARHQTTLSNGVKVEQKTEVDIDVV